MEEVKQVTCPKCNETKPLTELYWYRNAKASTGFVVCICKVCHSKYYKIRNRLLKEKETKAQADERFDPFCKAALKDQVKRMSEPTTSIYQEI
ncbi:MAG: hypothetical protein IMZ70_01350 [Candidatus Atribacteria bacterium]|nr:hypothetical protein [Candidatus Atribacteria bacterium]MBE3145008.1 hypothetical protein [Planctomycetota bacterium]